MLNEILVNLLLRMTFNWLTYSPLTSHLMSFMFRNFLFSLTPNQIFFVFSKKRWDNSRNVCCFPKLAFYSIVFFGVFSGDWLTNWLTIRKIYNFSMFRKYIYLYKLYFFVREYETQLKCLVVLAHNEDLPVSGRQRCCHFAHQNVNRNEWSLESLLGLT